MKRLDRFAVVVLSRPERQADGPDGGEASVTHTGVGTAIAAFCEATGLDARGFQRAFLVGGGPDHVVGIDTAAFRADDVFAGIHGGLSGRFNAEAQHSPANEAPSSAAPCTPACRRRRRAG